MVVARFAVVLLLVVLSGACGEMGQERARTSRGTAQLGGEVISTVDGWGITVAEVQSLVEASGLSPRDALTRLQEEALLAAEAERRRFGVEPDVLDVSRKALVQALLVERVEASRVSDTQIAAAYAEQHECFHGPERRAATHVLAKLRPDATPEQEAAARDFAEQALALLKTRPNPARAMQRFRGAAVPNLEIRVESLPAVPRDGRFVEAFLAAMFSTRDVGLVPEIVRTSYGYHVVAVTKIEPARNVSLADATPTLRRELEIEAHAAELEKLAAALRRSIGVTEESQAASAVASLELD